MSLINAGNSTIGNFLLIPGRNIDSIISLISQSVAMFVAPALVLAALYDVFFNGSLGDTLKRTVIAMVVITSSASFLKRSVETSFAIGDAILERAQRTNNLKLLKAWDRSEDTLISVARKIGKKNKQPSMWDILSIYAKTLSEDTVSYVLWLFTYGCFLLLKQIYTVYLYLVASFMALGALFYIFTPMQRAFTGIAISFLGLFLTPIITSVMLIILDSSFNFQFDNTGTIANNLEELINLGLVAILLLFSPVVAIGFASGSGVHQGVASMANTSAMGATMGYAAILKNRFLKTGLFSKRAGFAIGTALMSPAINKMISTAELFRSNLSEYANNVREKKNLNPTMQELQNEHQHISDPSGYLQNLSPLPKTEGLKSRLTRAREGFKNTNVKEKVAVFADNTINRSMNKATRDERKKLTQNAPKPSGNDLYTSNSVTPRVSLRNASDDIKGALRAYDIDSINKKSIPPKNRLNKIPNTKERNTRGKSKRPPTDHDVYLLNTSKPSGNDLYLSNNFKKKASHQRNTNEDKR